MDGWGVGGEECLNICYWVGVFWQCNSASFVAAAFIPTQSSLFVFYLLRRDLWRALL